MTPFSSRQRWFILTPLLLGTITAAIFVADGKIIPETVEASGKRQIATQYLPEKSAPSPIVRQRETTARPEAPGISEARGPQSVNPFRVHDWYVAPPPQAPTAPPLPFQFVGQLIEDNATRVFIRHRGRHLIIKTGDIIDETYVVEEISQGKIIFRYLPLKELQTLRTNPR